MGKKFVLAYSGGLDTSVMIPWLKEHYEGCEVVAVSGDVGLDGELDGLEEKAIRSGASKLYVLDLKKEFVEGYIFPAVKAGARYENQYLLGTALARPVIGKHLAEIARQEGADAIVHGCTGKGNDQVRFELSIRAFAPEIPILAPWRFWEIKGRAEEIDYAEAHHIPLGISRETNYSKDKNLWHLSHEGLELENPANAPQYAGNMEMGVTPEEAPEAGEPLSMEFVSGVPVSVNGSRMDAVELVTTLNALGGKHGVGILDMVENRLVGIKCRGVYETPAGSILYHAHEKLEQICLDRRTLHYKQKLALDFAELVYNGHWFTPLREAMSAFVDESQKCVTGVVNMKLYKGNIIDCGMTSPYSLYDADIATFDEDTVYDQADSQGFVNLYSLPAKIQARLNAKLAQQSG